MSEAKNYLGVILVRGKLGAKQEVKDTLQMLRLQTTNTLAVHEDTEVVRGMLKKVKDYVTYGELKKEVMDKLKKEYGEKNTYNLKPPRGGFERKGVKKPYKLGGVLGYRLEKINELIEKMI